MTQTRQIPQKLKLPDAAIRSLVADIAGNLTDLSAGWRQQATALLEAQLEFWCACSPFLYEHAQRQPQLIAGALATPLDQARLPQAQPATVISAMVNRHLEQSLDEASLMAELRVYRNVEMLRLIIGALSGLHSLDQTLAATTELADACIIGATRYSHQQLIQRYGEPLDDEGQVQQLVVLGMGKLGGGELNFSSDIDLICAFRAAGETTGDSNGKRRIDNGEFFRRVTQAMARILGKMTVDGFVFRVDLRLRPFGDSGPLVMNFAGLEHYYLTQGREWERYAMIKARSICGLAQDRLEVEQLLSPFVYRRYLDYGAIESLRDLKQRIVTKVRQQGMEENIKLGPGGIREIEFIGQAFQLVRGGREPELQIRPIQEVLNVLAELNLLSVDDVEQLTLAYQFLRRAENCLQMMRDQQQHTLPDDALDQARLHAAMGFVDWDGFSAELALHRASVQRVFQELFQLEDEAGDNGDEPFHDLWLSVADHPDLVAELTRYGFEQPQPLADTLQEFVTSVFYRNLTSQAVRRVDTLMPKVLHVVQQHDGSHQALIGMLQLVRSVAGRSVYLQVLIETPDALALIGRLFARSSFVRDFVCQHPIVIDELLDYRNIESPPDRTALQHEMQFVLQRVGSEELDVQMDALRQFKQANTMRVAAAELEQQLDLMRVSDHLSWIAEVTLEAVVTLVWEEMTGRYGQPQCQISGVTRVAGFAIVAYGKLGGLELGYGSDLDLVFLHESEGTELGTSGDKAIENVVFFARLAQKIVHFISTLTPAGTLYEIDTRLRPNGRAGMLVSSLSAFDSYQRTEAWTWEHQALVRARMVVGNARIRRRFAGIRTEVLCRHRQPDELRAEVAQMRARMRAELAGRGDTFDLKQDAGGIADIEFMVQYMVLWNASVYRELTLDTDNFRILERIERLGFIPPETAVELREAYLDFRRIVHRFALLDRRATIPLKPEVAQPSDTDSGVRLADESRTAAATSIDDSMLEIALKHKQSVSRCWQQLMGETSQP